KDPESTPQHTPWWLLMLRLLALAAAIFAFAEPVLNPRNDEGGSGRLLVLLDASWASADDWSERQDRLDTILAGATRDGRAVALRLLTAPLPPEADLGFAAPQNWVPLVAGLEPNAWDADRAGFAAWLAENPQEDFETIWLSDGLGPDAGLAAALQEFGKVTIVTAMPDQLALLPAFLTPEGLAVPVLRSSDGAARKVQLQAIGPTPAGVTQVLWQTEIEFEAGQTRVEALFDMPLELRNRVRRIALVGVQSAGAVVLADGGLQRRKVGLYAPRQMQEGPQLVAPLFYLRKALAPSAELIEAGLEDLLQAAPDVLVFADIGELSQRETERVLEWVENGGTLLRFAGPRLAANTRGIADQDPLLPVRLRAGGRSLGGAMTWDSPKRLRPFPDDGVFAGLTAPDEVEIRAQVLAQPDPDLPGRVLAALEDGTPLVTGINQGQGRIILFHVTANAEWSNLPLSGLFVDMLTRLSVSSGGGAVEAKDLEGQVWTPVLVLNGFGTLTESDNLAAVAGVDLGVFPRSAATPPGMYQNNERDVAINLLPADFTLETLSGLPTGITQSGFSQGSETLLKPLLLGLAMILLIIDIMATLFVSGRLIGPRAASVLLAFMAFNVADAQAQDNALIAANNTVLAYVITGDQRIDAISQAGLSGLSKTLFDRTSIEPVEPMGIDIENDDISIIPFLYWPITQLQASLSDAAVTRVNAFLRNGGMIMFDTRDAHLGQGFGGGSANGLVLQRLAQQLEIPPLAPIESDHVLTRSFYLLEVFPGRWRDGTVWVEAPTQLTTIEGAPFRNLNDGVTPVIIGGNDWASAWAISPNGRPMYPVGMGRSGDRQRELALRFGVNLIMYVMTGNYKSDQVHVPALLERLGQ
ncbi:MAG: DUF4159 domain-containing protein, partial [Rhodobacteraceae bacterium]|nr:DUF4159 domain-containing protein [Paracoccaceae bacterium]